MLLEVNRRNYRETRVVDEPPATLESGQIRLSVERFALTTNNVTYAVAGDMLDYWGFFPTEPPWGRVPVMGLASIIESANADLQPGGRYFGFYPMADEAVIEVRSTRDGFRDIGSHRANHAAAYTDFTETTNDVLWYPDRVDEYLLLRGLFATSYLIDDFLADSNFYGAAQTLVTSASSKTSICLAACLKKRGHPSIGLTSERNLAFVQGLGLYDRVITYDEVDTLDRATPSILVDMAGGGAVPAAVHLHFGAGLMHSAIVGATHWEEPGDAGPLPGPTPEMFFAPGQIAKRSQEWGAAELMSRMAGSLHEVLDDSSRWLTVTHHIGPEAVAGVFADLVDGNADPAVGLIASMKEIA